MTEAEPTALQNQAELHPLPEVRWFLCGVVGGAIMGAAHAMVALAIIDQEQSIEVICILAIIEGLIAGAFAVLFRRRAPKDCSIFTWLGFVLGLLFALILFSGVFNILAGIGRPKGVSAVLITPAMAGILVGGILDRIAEPFLFSRDQQSSIERNA